MAYSKQPVQDTYITRRLPVIGGQTIPSVVSAATTYQGSKFINCYPKRIRRENTDDKWVVTRTPAIVESTRTYTGSGTDPLTCVSEDGVYIWKGRRLYNASTTPGLVYTAGAAYSVINMYPVTNAVSTNTLYAGFLLDGANIHSYTYDATTNTFTLSAALSFTTASVAEVSQKTTAYLNSRLYIIGPGGRIYNSGAGAYTTWNTTWFIVPEIRGDETIAIANYRNHIAAFGRTSLEFFQDGGIEIGSPLVRQEQYTQLFGISRARNYTQTGDKLFFLSWEDRFGYGVYTLDSFTVKRLSDHYIDSVLNNNGMNGGAPFLTGMGMIDMFGDPCLAFSLSSSLPGTLCYCFSSKHGVWFTITLPNSASSNFTQFASTLIISEWVTAYYQNEGSDVVRFFTFSKEYSATGTVPQQAEIVYDLTYFDSLNEKHVVGVGLVGDYGTNSVTLLYSKAVDYTGWVSCGAKVQSTLGSSNTIRWWNLGPMRQAAFRIIVLNGANFMHEGLEVTYNFGQV